VREGRFERLIVTNTVPPFRLTAETAAAHITVLDVAPLLAEAIRRLHCDEPLEELRAFGLPQVSASV
jgi:ribose-phosphate pyrophosphokinase